MTERNQFSRSLYRLDCSDASRHQYVSFCHLIRFDLRNRLRAKCDHGFSRGHSLGYRFARDVHHSDGSVLRNMRKVVIQALSPDGDHPAARLVIVTEIMLFWLAFDHFAEEPAQMLIPRALPHRRLDIEFEMAAEAGPQFSFTSQPQFVA